MRRSACVLLLLLAFPLVAADEPYETCTEALETLDLEDTPAHEACVTQVDGGSLGDASDECAAPSPDVLLGQTFQGWLAPPSDPEDDYALNVPTAGILVVVSIASQPGAGVSHELTVWRPSGSALCADDLGTATPGDPFAFTAPVAGTYTLQVVEVPADPLLPETRMCHLMCAIQDHTGYEVQVG